MADPQTTPELPAMLRQIATEMDDEAVSPPCSDAELIREGAAEIERLRAENKKLKRPFPAYPATVAQNAK